MKNTLIIIFIILVLMAGASYFLGEKTDGPHEEIYIVGKIYSISENRILIAEGLEGEEYTGNIDELRGNAIWLTIKEETEIKGRKNIEDFNLGDEIEVWIVGPVLESYPAQGVASKIVLISESIRDPENGRKVDEKCFIGGCSGELCGDDPELLQSTCEYLPGAICLQKAECKVIDDQCQWVLSEASAACFIETEKEYGDTVRETRIGYLFSEAEEKASELFE